MLISINNSLPFNPSMVIHLNLYKDPHDGMCVTVHFSVDDCGIKIKSLKNIYELESAMIFLKKVSSAINRACQDGIMANREITLEARDNEI